MPTIITRGAGSAQGLGYASSSASVNYIEDVFSTYLYTGNGTTQTITNGIDLSGKGGLVWIKNRAATDGAGNTANHILMDTVLNGRLRSNTSGALSAGKNITDLSNGFTVTGTELNYSADNYASWTFREQPKFFDVVTYTGDGVAGRTVAHNLGSAPGCMFVKRTDASGAWHVFHTSLGGTKALFLNGTNAAVTNIRYWNDTAPTSTVFTLGYDTDVNASGGTYVAYLFAHDAGGFGLTGTDNVISCGSFTTDGSGNATVSLGYEPQWVLIKQTDGVDSWYLNDNMRGLAVSGNQPNLSPNSTAAESAGGYNTYPNATGFTASVGIASKAYIYIAIRRGPMKVPTSGTSVFNPAFRNATLPGYTSNFPVDWATRMYRPGGANQKVGTRLLGGTSLQTNTTSAAASDSEMTWDYMSGWGNDAGATSDLVSHMFRRAPGFFDVVCYTGTLYSAGTYPKTHNLGVTPELIILKKRDASSVWYTWTTGFATTAVSNEYLSLNTTSGKSNSNDNSIWGSSPPTASVFNVGQLNNNLNPYVAYLFATVAGVSKVGSYTGTGTTQTINCGFTAGARFVLIKRTDSTGDWYVWDSARGIVAGNDPYLLLNSTAAEVTGTDYVDTAASGFEISSTAPAAINANGGSFIFLAIA